MSQKMKGSTPPKNRRAENDLNLNQLAKIIYEQIDKALVTTPQATYADILNALDKQCDQRIAHNKNDEFAHIMKMTLNVMQYYYARLANDPDPDVQSWLELRK